MKAAMDAVTALYKKVESLKDTPDYTEAAVTAIENSPEADAVSVAMDKVWEKDPMAALTLERWTAVKGTLVHTILMQDDPEYKPNLEALVISSWKAARTQLDQSPKSFDIATEFLADSQLEPKQDKAVFRQKLMEIVSDMCLEEEVRHFSAQHLNQDGAKSTNNKAMDVLITAGMEADQADFAVADLRRAANAKTKPLAQRGDFGIAG